MSIIVPISIMSTRSRIAQTSNLLSAGFNCSVKPRDSGVAKCSTGRETVGRETRGSLLPRPSLQKDANLQRILYSSIYFKNDAR